MNLTKLAFSLTLFITLPVYAAEKPSEKKENQATETAAKTDTNAKADEAKDTKKTTAQSNEDWPPDPNRVDPLKVKGQAPYFKNIGSLSNHPIATNSALAQLYFNQGLTLYYGFEWGESIRSFREATRLDPNCAMCYWGLALALGSKANAPMNGNEYKDAKEAALKAQELAKHGPVSETDYTTALVSRFQHEPKPVSPAIFSCHTTGAMLDASNSKELIAYSQAMQKLVTKYPRDNDAKALYAFSVFDAIDWKFWNAEGRINSLTPNVMATLDTVLMSNSRHVAANHYYIHVLEQSPQPENAIANADRLKTLVPISEHLVHMPTHIYFLTGRYHDGSESNQKAIAAYKNYVQTCKSQGFEPEITYLYHHNFDFLRTTATMEGRKALALSAAQELVANLPKSWLEQNRDLQGFLPIPYFVKARFGLWQDLLKEPKPEDKYQYATGMWLYAQGLASARTGNLEGAEEKAKQLYRIIAKGPSDDALGQAGNQLLTIAYEVLAASIADLHKDESSTFSHLNTALKIQHDMGYHEPPDWYFPITQALGDAYLKWNRPRDAINMYDQALRKYPKNGWALYGIMQSLRALNQPEKVKIVEPQFRNAWANADVSAPISLFPTNEATTKTTEKSADTSKTT